MNQSFVEEDEGRNSRKSGAGVNIFLRLLSKSSILPILLLLWIIFAILSPAFGTLRNVQTMLAATAVVAVAAIGETLVLISAGIDLSVATVAACSAVLAAKAMESNGNPLIGLIVALGIGVIFGIVNGLSVAKLGLTPFVLTLGTHLIARGIAFSVSKGYAIRAPKVIRQFGNTKWLGLPAIAVIAIGMLLIFGFLLARTNWGRYVYLLGSNESAARYAGIRCVWVKTSVYVIAGLLSGLAGFLSIANLGAAIPGVGDTILLTIIGGVILGGTSLFGGFGSMARTVVGVLLLQTLANGLNLLGFDFYDQLIAQGVVIVIGTGLIVRLGKDQSV